MKRSLTALIALIILLPLSAGLSANGQLEKATFAGGCFWCMVPPFEKLPGVVSVTSGYTGGRTENPTYEQVESGKTGHVEAIEVVYDPGKISYQQLLDVFWRQINPTDAGGQFVDRGEQYKSMIFYHNEEQKKLASASKQALAETAMFALPIVTGIVPATKFYRAEEYHQDYYKKHPIKYKYYRERSGRDQFLEKAWADDKLVGFPPYTEKNYRKPSRPELKEKLTPLQFKVTQEKGTEPAFNNLYWNNERQGIYVDLISGEPLFSSLDKFDSGTGWPSFTRPLEPGNIVEKEDRAFLTTRTEIRSRHGDNHIGHVFNDGPPPTKLRYCMNSAALRFIPREDLAGKGYGKYLPLFGK